MSITDSINNYIDQCPSFDAWAGTGPRATAAWKADQDGYWDRMVNFRAACVRALARLVDDGMSIDEAIESYDPETV